MNWTIVIVCTLVVGVFIGEFYFHTNKMKKKIASLEVALIRLDLKLNAHEDRLKEDLAWRNECDKSCKNRLAVIEKRLPDSDSQKDPEDVE